MIRILHELASSSTLSSSSPPSSSASSHSLLLPFRGLCRCARPLSARVRVPRPRARADASAAGYLPLLRFLSRSLLPHYLVMRFPVVAFVRVVAACLDCALNFT